MQIYQYPPSPAAVIPAGSATAANQVLEIAAIQALQPAPTGLVVLDFSVSNVTDAAYTELIAAAPVMKKIQIFMSSGDPLYLATGAAASEVNRSVIIPGGNGLIDYNLAAGQRLSLKAVVAGTTVNTGMIIVNFLG